MGPFFTALLVFVAAYLVGSLPTAYLLSRMLRGYDIRTVGSRNAGAVNVYREVGPPAGLLVMGLDALKGAGVVLAIEALGLPDYALFTGALATMAGHNWPLFLRFRGGKGVATILGISLAVLPLWTLAAVAIALAADLATRSVVFGIVSGIVAINAMTVATGQGMVQISLCLTLSAIVAATHYGMTYREVVRSVRQKGWWGLFAPE